MFGRETLAAVCGISACTLLATSAFGASPSFSCEKASQPVERLICNHGELSGLDAELEAVFRRTLSNASQDRSKLLAAQRQWLRTRLSVCQVSPASLDEPITQECLADLYRRRIAELSSTSQPVRGQSAAMCSSLAQQISALAPAETKDYWNRPLRALHDLSDSFRLAIETRFTKKQVKDDLRANYLANDDLVKAAANLSHNNDLFIFLQAAGSINVAYSFAGSLGCQRFVFFRPYSEGKARQITAPPSLNEMSFCGGAQGALATLSGSPMFIGAQVLGDGSVRMVVNPWADGKWRPKCSLHVKFENSIYIDKEFCALGDCEKIAARALPLAEQFLRQPNAIPAHGTLWDFRHINKLLAGIHGDAELPTFGTRADIDFQTFAADTVVVPLKIDGEDYIALIGSASRGWRVSHDILFAALKTKSDGGLEPVAGVYLVNKRGKVASIDVK